jgi:hypothetical protein
MPFTMQVFFFLQMVLYIYIYIYIYIYDTPYLVLLSADDQAVLFVRMRWECTAYTGFSVVTHTTESVDMKSEYVVNTY